MTHIANVAERKYTSRGLKAHGRSHVLPATHLSRLKTEEETRTEQGILQRAHIWIGPETRSPNDCLPHTKIRGSRAGQLSQCFIFQKNSGIIDPGNNGSGSTRKTKERMRANGRTVPGECMGRGGPGGAFKTNVSIHIRTICGVFCKGQNINIPRWRLRLKTVS